MGKDNTTFHTVIFPSTLIGSKLGWTMLKTISTTEYLNYEIDEKTGKPKKFSKSRKTGIFGDDAKSTEVPCEVWRYYLLINRPETKDTVFLWKDFIDKNNNELLKNLGNFSNRCLKYLKATYDGVVPAYEGGKKHKDDEAFISTLFGLFNKIMTLMEDVKIKESLKTVMDVSGECNEYFQHQAPWVLIKTDPVRCKQVLNTSIQAMFLLASLLEPFMPSFSAKIYNQLAIQRTAQHENMYQQLIENPALFDTLVPSGHTIGEPMPIFKEIPIEKMEEWKAQFAGLKE